MRETLEKMFKALTTEFSLPENTFSVSENYSKTGVNSGELISTEIDIQERSYPPDAINSIAKTTLVLYIKPNKNYYELLIHKERMPYIVLPSAAIRKSVSDNLYVHILFNFDDTSVYDFIADNIRFCINNYTSSATFGCCSKYAECSSSSKCVHQNILYAKGCRYRENLENGNIFYK